MRDSGTYRLNVTIRENGKKVTQPLYVRIGNNNKPDVSLPTGLFTDNEPQKQEPALVVQPDTSADPTDKYDAVRKRAERAFDELDKEVEKLQGQDKQNKLEVQPKVEPVCDVKCTIKRKLIQRQN
jgi:SLT domain-containing protein